MILIAIKYVTGCSEHRKQMKGILLFWSTSVFCIFLVLAPLAAVTDARVSGSEETTGTQMFQQWEPAEPALNSLEEGLSQAFFDLSQRISPNLH